MSQHTATTAARKPRRTRQALRFSAIITAGMASIGLTVAAGSYIANQMPEAQKSGGILAAPTGPRGPMPVRDGAGADPVPADYPAVAENIGLTSFFTSHPVRSHELWVPPALAGAASESVVAQRPAGITGQVRLGNAYVGAQVAPAQRNSVTLTLDTNVFAAVADLVLRGELGDTLGLRADPTANTQVRTEFDTRRGEFTITVTDPAIGRHGVQVARRNAPAPAEQATLAEQATVAEDTTGDEDTIGESFAVDGAPVRPLTHGEDGAVTTV
ncbi:hypothetical protein [Nocardia sp. NPDC127526]|uniref:hypothetical protein n=1 Tax=Nocardia sp. NPDC127526 TaxID=3345393 RepID=UPI003637982C